MYKYIKDIPAMKPSAEIEIKGWISGKRSSGKISFLQIRDGTGFIQAVVEEKKVGQAVFARCNRATIESSVVIRGTVKKDDRAPIGFEIDTKDIEIIQVAEDYPIQKKDHGTSFLLDHRHLWLRSKKQWAIQKVRNTIINAIYEHLNAEGFTKIDAPILTPTSCEGTTTLFEVPYTPSWKEGAKDGEKVYLSQSGQLYIEAALFAHGRVFDFGPTFRAEKSKTRRHLTEFWMMDAEAAFVEHKDNMKIQEELTIAVIQKVLQDDSDKLKMLDRDISKLELVVKGDFPVISHKEAIEKLQKMGVKIETRDDLGADDETVLSKEFDKPLFIEKYPKEIKSFYMKEDPNDSSRVLCDDMLAPEGYGEVIGGSQREDDYDTLLARIQKEGLSVSDFQWYLDLRKYGSVPHSGFGIGLERYVAWICGLKHIRETIPFPRMIHRIRP